MEMENLKNECKKNNDLIGLVQIYSSIEGGSLFTFAQNFCKICYFAGRMNNAGIIENFLIKKRMPVDMLPQEYKDFSKFIFQFGLRFPKVSNSDLQLLESYYTKQEYVDLLDDILFDIDKLPRKIKKFDKELLSIKHTNFSEDFINDIFDKALYNAEILYDAFEEFYYYDKVSNSILKMSSDECENGIHYQIHFPTTFNDFSDAIDELLGEEIRIDFYSKHLNDMFPPDLPYEFAIHSQFNLIYYNLFQVFISNSRGKYNLEKEKLEQLKRHLTLKWLNEINS